MDLTVKRQSGDGNCTLGMLQLNGAFFCNTLEPASPIPAGEYIVTVTYSPKFQRFMPLVNDVPGYSGIRIHPGNDAADTEGCLLVGDGEGSDSISASRDAFDRLFPLIQSSFDWSEKITLTYEDQT